MTAAVAAALATWLLLTPPARVGSPRRPPWAWLAAPVPLALVVVEVRWAVLAGIALATVTAGLALVRRRRRRLGASSTSARVLETCELLAGELSAGQPPAAALARAAASWPPLAEVVHAQALGADVPPALRRLAREPGAADLRLVAAAWHVAQRSGHGLGDALERCARGLRAAAASRRVVEGELASARATARLVAALPLVAHLLGSSTGADPTAFLVGTPVGLACLAGGLCFGVAGLWWIEAIAADIGPSG